MGRCDDRRGALASQAIPDPKRLGMDFAFTAAFIAIALSLFRGRANLAPWAVSLAVVVLFVETGWLAAPWALVLGGLFGGSGGGDSLAMTNPWVMILPLALGTFAIRLAGALLGRRIPTHGACGRARHAPCPVA